MSSWSLSLSGCRTADVLPAERAAWTEGERGLRAAVGSAAASGEGCRVVRAGSCGLQREVELRADSGVVEVLSEVFGALGEPGGQGGAVDVQLGRGRGGLGVVPEPAGQGDPQVRLKAADQAGGPGAGGLGVEDPAGSVPST